MRRVVIAHGGICGVEAHRRIAGKRIGADDLQGEPRVLGIVCCPPRGLVAGVRSIHTNKNSLVVDHGDLLEIADDPTMGRHYF